jgi:hypothetical protein
MINQRVLPPSYNIKLNLTSFLSKTLMLLGFVANCIL